VEVPDIQYTRSGDVAIAYQVLGDGPVDVVWFRGMAGDLLSTWDQPLIVRHATGLAAFSRLLMLDKRGTGLSDRVREAPTLETRMDDVRAVMDAKGSKRALATLLRQSMSPGAATSLDRMGRGSRSRSEAPVSSRAFRASGASSRRRAERARRAPGRR
jgi:pimeloyl-ACP methyl ester carboxylesterase